jgi:2-polyprenyl-3-methyl-5-hydroxy-6-metoxy-1,4-benzoquinol methylase
MTREPVWNYLKSYYSGRVPAEAVADGQYTLLICRECGCIWQKEILDESGMTQLYSVWIDAESSYYRKHRESVQVRIGFARQCIQVVKAIKKPPEAIHVLDYGMGWGNWLLMARAFGFEADGLEVSAERIEQARQRGLSTVMPVQIGAETFDFINSEAVFEHLVNPLESLKDCWKWLKPGGAMRIAVPNGAGLSSKIAQKRWQIGDMTTRPLEHINVFDPGSLRRLISEAGFEPLHPPLVLPATSWNRAELKQFAGILVADLLTRVGMYSTTSVWLRKPSHVSA